MILDKSLLSDGVIELRLTKVLRNIWLAPVAYQYDIFRCNSEIMVGRCDYRCLNDEENYYAGNIGYMVYQAYRGHHYAYRASRLLCSLAADLKAERLYITCSPDNIASRKTIEKLGADYIEETEVPKDHYLYAQGEKIKEIFVLKLRGEQN